MRIGVFGAGYVGVVTAAVFAELGHQVTCMDVDEAKVARLQSGEPTIYEPGLAVLLERNLAKQRLLFTTDPAAAVATARVVFIAVGTPPGQAGHADLRHVLAAAGSIGANLGGYTVVVNKSTVPVGTGELIHQAVRQHAPAGAQFDVCSNPEFLREGSAVSDALRPDRIVIGAAGPRAARVLAELYAPFGRPIIHTDIASAELIKYASNAYLASRISFINAIADLCEQVGADVAEVAAGMAADHRIGPHGLAAGLGYGGSCFPKDTACLAATLRRHGCDPALLEAVQAVNAARVPRAVQRLAAELGTLAEKTIGILGLAFKPGTDDLREAKAVELARALVAAGATVRAYDPVAMPAAAALLPEVQLCADPYQAARGCHALVLATEWEEFRLLDLPALKAVMADPLLLDGRNALDRQAAEGAGFRYLRVGSRAARPIGSRAARPVGSRAARPVGSGAARPVGSRAARPVGTRAALVPRSLGEGERPVRSTAAADAQRELSMGDA